VKNIDKIKKETCPPTGLFEKSNKLNC